MATTIRQAGESDIAQAAEVEKACWPASLCFARDRLTSILSTFPEGFIVAETAGNVVGFITSLRVDRAMIVGPYPSWHDITGNGLIAGTHKPDGNCLFVMAVSVYPFIQNNSIGRRLVNAELDLARRLPGVASVLGYTRIPRYRRKSHLSVEEYLTLKRPDGRYFDSVLDFHVGNGARVIKPVPGARPRDEKSLGYGVLISYDAHLRGN
ncbi:MAG: GNAT family N-acetyltransferase [Planctomycetes bacterium]|nr:GNAT family N-acetyltransferase [Planctomycetota bacterium]